MAVTVLAIIQARVSSTRLPGKVLRTILGKPMLQLQIERINAARKIDQLVVATSDQPSDQPLVELCRQLKVDCFRGNLENVLDRFYQCARRYRPEVVVRLTGDCPLIDPTVIDQVIQHLFANDYEYVSNTVEPTYPDGLDVEAFHFKVLETAWREATLSSERDHVTPFIWKQPDRFRIANVKNDTDLSHMRWTVDKLEDFQLVESIYKGLYPETPLFTTEDILQFFRENPDLLRLNEHSERNEGYQKSLKEDKAVEKS